MEYDWHPFNCEKPTESGRSYVLWVTDGKGREWTYGEICVWNNMQQRFIGSKNNSPQWRIVRWALTENANKRR
jgi:hypothetical protein